MVMDALFHTDMGVHHPVKDLPDPVIVQKIGEDRNKGSHCSLLDHFSRIDIKREALIEPFLDQSRHNR